LPETAPYNGIDTKGFGDGTGPIGWQLAHPFMLKKLYNFYGDKAFIEDQYQTVVNMVEFLKTQAEDNLINHGISDHVSIDPKPEALTSGAFYYHIVSLLVEFAEILENDVDVEKYGKLKSEIRNSFIQRYLVPETGEFGDEPSQITQTFGLYYDLLPEISKSKALEVLSSEIIDRHQDHLSTGIFGTKMLFDVLRLYERNDIAYTIVNQKDYPGYGYMLENDATTLWEHWDKSNNQNSKNHPMFGSVSEWYFRALSGINPDENAIAFNPVIIKPLPVKDLEYVNASYKSIRGEIVSNWQKTDHGQKLEVEIPGNTAAYIYVPVAGDDRATITESGKTIFSNGDATPNADLQFIQQNKNHAIFSCGGGKYVFEISSN
jgi:alpha-L-rhamnosidase